MAASEGIISSAPTLAELGARVLTFLLSIFGVVAVISFVIAGIILLVSAGNEQVAATAKRALFYSVVGIVVALGSIVLVRTVGGLLGG